MYYNYVYTLMYIEGSIWFAVVRETRTRRGCSRCEREGKACGHGPRKTRTWLGLQQVFFSLVSSNALLSIVGSNGTEI